MRLKNEELAVLVILVCALLAVGALCLLSGFTERYTWSSVDGDRVSITGLVLSKENTFQGGHIILCVRTEAGPLNVFVPATTDAYPAANETSPGDEVEVIGTVQTYKGQKEVVAEKVKEK